MRAEYAFAKDIVCRAETAPIDSLRLRSETIKGLECVLGQELVLEVPECSELSFFGDSGTMDVYLEKYGEVAGSDILAIAQQKKIAQKIAEDCTAEGLGTCYAEATKEAVFTVRTMDVHGKACTTGGANIDFELVYHGPTAEPEPELTSTRVEQNKTSSVNFAGVPGAVCTVQVHAIACGHTCGL